VAERGAELPGAPAEPVERRAAQVRAEEVLERQALLVEQPAGPARQGASALQAARLALQELRSEGARQAVERRPAALTEAAIRQRAA
jgi:hypothetical protein